MLNQFRSHYNAADQRGYMRLEVKLPTQPYNDLLERLTDLQSQDFYDKLKTLKSVLEQARDASSRKKACELLRAQFGADFPVPEDEGQKDDASGSRTVPQVIVGSGSSA